MLRDISRQTDILMAIGLIGLIGMMLVPLPPVLLDLLLATNLALALCILLLGLYIRRALDFSVFPSLLLVTTLFRLALNISSTRLILLHANAGRVIECFGNFVIGGDLLVGSVIFLILVVIQFVVITNGAGRIYSPNSSMQSAKARLVASSRSSSTGGRGTSIMPIRPMSPMAMSISVWRLMSRSILKKLQASCQITRDHRDG
jgi:predicted neutral ceramidase superfamily lipid hydrolase